MKSKRAPAGLGSAGRSFWKEITELYELRPDEHRVLEQAARELDLIARLEAELAEAPTMVRGSQGQLVINGMIQELRQHRSAFTSMMRFLKLPDEAEKEAQKAVDRSTEMRRIANIRHARARGLDRGA
ncbi:hypothetical protein [Pseudonocardia acaciae]|uniref:hypothetical protein n=1 Tax=Pseudonocardia acaciae TaxID=551276 RepID=UPI00048B1BCD|nr:hypothetical protein [Pseudonocardia acaciae]